MPLEAIVPTAKGRIDERKRLGFANHRLQLFGRGLVGKRLLSFPEPYNSSMRLERVGAVLIVSAIILFKIAFWRVTCPPHSWCNVYLPFAVFLVMALGALLGVVGMVAIRVQKGRERHL